MEGLLLQLDVDGDGVVTKQEFADWYRLHVHLLANCLALIGVLVSARLAWLEYELRVHLVADFVFRIPPSL